MAESNNYFWWSPEKWANVICVSARPPTPEKYEQYRAKFADMTHHERRLLIRKLLHDPKVAAQVFK